MDSYLAVCPQLYFVFYNKHARFCGEECLLSTQKVPDAEESLGPHTGSARALPESRSPSPERFKTTVFYPDRCSLRLAFSERSVPCQTGLNNHLSSQPALPGSLVTLTHQSLQNIGSLRYTVLEMPPLEDAHYVRI